jgi:hypothetical protein
MRRVKEIVILLLLSYFFIPLCAFSQITATSSSVQENFQPQYAVDGNMATRWSSDPSDPQWLLLELDQPKIISGMTIYWETAFAEDYSILISLDNKEWKTVFETKGADGKTDDIYFKPQEARYIKIFCQKRATSWGDSIFEIKLKDRDEVPLIAVSSGDNSQVSNIMDGNIETSWTTKENGKQWIAIDLKKIKPIGGFELNWGKSYAKNYQISVSSNNIEWREVFKSKKSNGGKDLVYIDPVAVRFIKIKCNEPSTKGYSLREVFIKGNDEHASPQKYYEVLAEESPAGYFPKWLYKEQEYWTVVGVDADINESLISENGTIEPYKNGFSIMPFIYTDNKLVTAYDCKVEQKLEKNYLPIASVLWDYNGLELKQTLFAHGKKGLPVTYAWYKLKNNTTLNKKGKVYLAIRPLQLNPPWQYGGMSEISNIECRIDVDPAIIKIDNKEALIILTKPDDAGAVKNATGEIIDYISEGKIPTEKQVFDVSKLATAAVSFEYDLAAGKEEDIFFYMPHRYTSELQTIKIADASAYYNKILSKTINYWDKKLSKLTIDIPQQEVVDVFKSNIIYLLINRDDFALQPGARNYERSWIRDGSVMAAALLRAGYFDEVRQYLDWVTTCQKPNGELPCILERNGQVPNWANTWTEWDGQGAYVFAISDYYRFTKDRKFLEDKFDNVLLALRYIETLRKQRLTSQYKGTYFYGILPESNSHEGYFPAQHSLWDDFWALKGLKEGQYLAKELGREDEIPWMKKEENELRENLINNIRLIQKKRGIKNIPGCFEKADFDATSTAISVWPTEENECLVDVGLMHTLDTYYNNTLLPRIPEGAKSAYTPYEIRTATAYLMLGEKEKALTMMNYFLRDRRPLKWNHWGEVVHDIAKRPQYIGDMPHTWVGAICANFIRSLFVYERDDTLYLAAGIDDKWLENSSITVRNLPTYYGDINYSISKELNKFQTFIFRKNRYTITCNVTGNINCPKDLIFIAPCKGPVLSAKVNGRSVSVKEDKKIQINKLPAKIVILSQE